MFNWITPRQLTSLLGVIILLFMLFSGGMRISRIGETKLTITTIPDDADISINDAPSLAVNYLRPGEYKVSASKEGFKTDTLRVKVGKAATEVGLIPSPESEAARRWLADNPDVQLQREAIGGLRASARGLEIRKNSPIIGSLPFTDIIGPFTIDYGPSKTRPSGVFIEISNSSPDGRTNALKWIKKQGQNPADLEIRYLDFINPLVSARGDE